jgi:hypothetical protein
MNLKLALLFPKGKKRRKRLFTLTQLNASSNQAKAAVQIVDTLKLNLKMSITMMTTMVSRAMMKWCTVMGKVMGLMVNNWGMMVDLWDWYGPWLMDWDWVVDWDLNWDGDLFLVDDWLGLLEKGDGNGHGERHREEILLPVEE